MTVQIDHTSLGSGYDRRTCWLHARVGLLPLRDGLCQWLEDADGDILLPVY